MAQSLLQVSGLQHDAEHEELQGLRQVALLRGPRAQGQGHDRSRYTWDEKAGRELKNSGKHLYFKYQWRNQGFKLKHYYIEEEVTIF